MQELLDPTPELGTLMLHFDVSEHVINLDTFLETATQARTILQSFNTEFFDGSLEYELILLPPVAGSFLGKLKIYVGGGLVVAATFLNSDLGEGYVVGLTGETPKHWAEKAGQATANGIDEISALVQSSKDSKKKTVEIVLKEMTKGVLSKDNDELKKIAPLSGQLNNAVQARCNFYEACLRDKEVKGIDFSTDDDFPIRRNDFPRLAIRPEPPINEDENPEWHTSIENIYVTSPNWERDNQKARNWKGRDGGRKDCLFVIEDNYFWHQVKYRGLHVAILDQLKVQWIFQFRGTRIINRRVIRVLEFNGDHLSDPMKSDEIEKFTGEAVLPMLTKPQDRFI